MWNCFCAAANLNAAEIEKIVMKSEQQHDDIPHNFGFLILQDDHLYKPAKTQVEMWYPILDWSQDNVKEKYIEKFLDYETHPMWVQTEQKWYTRSWAAYESHQSLCSDEDEWIYNEGTDKILYELEKLREKCQQLQAFRLLKLVDMYLENDMYNSSCWKVMQRKNMCRSLITNPESEQKYWLDENRDGSFTFVPGEKALPRLLIPVEDE
jgi:hypothetical protein